MLHRHPRRHLVSTLCWASHVACSADPPGNPNGPACTAGARGEGQRALPTLPMMPALPRPSARRYAEIGSSAAILDAGYNIDALMLRYQGVDWRDKVNWGCNAG